MAPKLGSSKSASSDPFSMSHSADTLPSWRGEERGGRGRGMGEWRERNGGMGKGR